AGWFIALAMPTAPDPPGMFTTTTDCLSSSPSCLPSCRIIASSGDPADDVQMNRIGLSGYPAATAGCIAVNASSNTAQARSSRDVARSMFIMNLVLVVAEAARAVRLPGTRADGLLVDVDAEARAFGQRDVTVHRLERVGRDDVRERLVRHEVLGDDEVGHARRRVHGGRQRQRRRVVVVR